MDRPHLREFQRKAPLLDRDSLASEVVHNILEPELRERAAEIWILGSFINPDKGTDENGRSDMDLFVVVPDWDMPVADVSILFAASNVPTPPMYEPLSDDHDWKGIDAPDRTWDGSPDEAWERLPEYVRETLHNAATEFFYATMADKEQNRVRNYDLQIGNRQQFDYQYSNHRLLLATVDHL